MDFTHVKDMIFLLKSLQAQHAFHINDTSVVHLKRPLCFVVCRGLSKLTQINQQWNFTSGFTDTRGAIVWPHVHVPLFEVAVN